MKSTAKQTRIWLGRVRPELDEEHERFIAWMSGGEARKLLARFPLTEYRLEQRGAELSIWMTATEPTGLVRFLRFDRFWPAAWEYVGGSRPASDPPAAESLGPALRVHWRRASNDVAED